MQVVSIYCVMLPIKRSNKSDIYRCKTRCVIHCAALTDVAYCESHFRESFDVNVRGTSNVVEAMPKDSVFIYLSTDHVFNGNNWFSRDMENGVILLL